MEETLLFKFELKTIFVPLFLYFTNVYEFVNKDIIQFNFKLYIIVKFHTLTT